MQIIIGYYICYIIFKAIFRIFSSPVVATWLAHAYLIAYLVGILVMFMLLHFHPEIKDRMFVIAFYGMIFAINFFILPFYYWYDKKCSMTVDAARIPENVLHMLAFTGGAMSALASQRLFNHKTQKRSFQIITPIALVCTLLIFYVCVKYLPV
jgi:uncharacterized membrane protein YsdA (DUF1294 family)